MALDIISLGWIIYIGLFGLTVIATWLFVRYFSDKYEHEKLPTIVSIAALTIIIMAELLIPLDIYIVSNGVDVAHRQDVMKILYCVAYGAVLLFCFILVPFTYFYYEERDLEVTTSQRILAGVKYTMFLLIMIVILLVIGIFMKGNPVSGDNSASAYIRKLIAGEGAIERSIAFAMGCLGCLGFLSMFFYTAFGLSAFPIGLMKGRADPNEENQDVTNELHLAREKQKLLNSKYLGGRKVAAADQERISALQQQERNLARRAALLTDRADSWTESCLSCLRPFGILFGIFFQLISLLIVVSFVLSLIDRLANSYCGPSCGFLLKYPKLFNPLDQLFVSLSKVFPFDYIAFAALQVFIIMCTLSGIARVGIRLLCIRLFSFRAGRTLPQGLLMASLLLVLALIGFTFQLMTLTPQYVRFGSQHYTNTTTGEVINCATEFVTAKNCTMTQIGLLMTRLSLKMGFFGEVFYFSGWVFAACWFIGLVIAIVQKRPSAVDLNDEEELLYGE